MLRKARIILAAIFLVGITLLFTGIGQDWWGWMAKIQLLPAVLRAIGGATLGNLAVIAAILLLTLIFGRIYCSVICPMGVFQDIVIWIRRTIGKCTARCNATKARKYAAQKAEGQSVPVPKMAKPITKQFRYSPSCHAVRLALLVIFILTSVFLSQLLISLVAPYSNYGLMVQAVCSLIAGDFQTALIVTAAVTFAVMVLCAWIWGRGWCNTVCPVGTVLGYISAGSLFKIRIDESKCRACGRCGKACKASCINMETHSVDYTKCVDCFDCIDSCEEGAISFRFVCGEKNRKNNSDASCHTKPSQDNRQASDLTSGKTEEAAQDSNQTDEDGTKGVDRRKFLSTTAALGAAAVMARAQEMKVDGGLAPLEAKSMPQRSERLVPPGALSVKNFYDHCTACQLCVSVCPNSVLEPSKDLEHFLQPAMNYADGYCRPECTACSEVCPSGAIRPISRDVKTAIRIGTARVNPELCLAATDVENCGNCAQHCPTGAVRMVVDDSTATRRPVIDEAQCIGCGACEYLCPVRPLSAITVDGISIHQSK